MDALDGVPFNRGFYPDGSAGRVEAVLESGMTAGDGPACREAESFLSSKLDGLPTFLTPSCTHALELAALALELGPGDEVIIPSFAFVSVANAFRLRGAKVVFADVDPETLELSVETVAPLMSPATRVICAINYGGLGHDLEGLVNLAESHGVVVIEDNAHGLFSSQHGKALGTFGHISVTSFHQTKNFSCGEGGAITVRMPSLLAKIETAREKGTNRSEFMRGGVEKYTWQSLGSSWVLADALAAILLSQFEWCAVILEKRQSLWQAYYSSLSVWAFENQVVLHPPLPRLSNSGHLFPLVFPKPTEAMRFIDYLKAEGINAVFHYQALHESPMMKSEGRQMSLPVSSQLSDCLVRLPLFYSLSPSSQARVIERVKSFSVDC